MRFAYASVAILSLLAAPALVACTDAAPAQADEDITSNDANIVELEWEGEVVARAGEPAKQALITQLQYLSGHLSANGEAGAQTRLAQLVEATETSAANGTKKIAYRAAVPVAWPKTAATPETYELILPKDVTALARFNAKYDGACGKSHYGADRFWYDYNPRAAGCALADADVLRATATVRPHPRATQDRFPEYDKVWADGRLDVVMVNGIIGDDNRSDESYREIDTILASVADMLQGAETKENTPTESVRRDLTLTGTLGGGRVVSVRALNVHEVQTAKPDFDAAYGPASAKADLVVYSGHSGLSRHIKSLLSRTEVAKDRFQLVYLYGCNTLEYVDPDIYERKATTNGNDADPAGTKFLDIISTARPAYGDNGRSTLALVRGLIEAKKSYNELLSRDFSSSHLTVVFGEEDNTFTP